MSYIGKYVLLTGGLHDLEVSFRICLKMVTKHTVKILTVSFKIGQAGYLLNHPRMKQQNQNASSSMP